MVWAAEDIYFVGGILVVKKHTKGCITGPSTLGPPEQLEVSWEHRVDGGTNNLGVIPDKT